MDDMARNQSINAVDVIPSDTINIPNPGKITSGTNTSGAALTLTDAGQNFLNSATNPNGYNIRGGDVVYSAAGVICEIESVDSATQLTLKVPGIAAGTYDIYKGNVANGDSPGYSLFVGTTGDVAIQTPGGEDVVMKNVGNASFIPQQAIKVKAAGTTATDILALL
jgi:hypothetical protein